MSLRPKAVTPSETLWGLACFPAFFPKASQSLVGVAWPKQMTMQCIVIYLYHLCISTMVCYINVLIDKLKKCCICLRIWIYRIWFIFYVFLFSPLQSKPSCDPPSKHFRETARTEVTVRDKLWTMTAEKLEDTEISIAGRAFYEAALWKHLSSSAKKKIN